MTFPHCADATQCTLDSCCCFCPSSRMRELLPDLLLLRVPLVLITELKPATSSGRHPSSFLAGATPSNEKGQPATVSAAHQHTHLQFRYCPADANSGLRPCELSLVQPNRRLLRH